MCSSSTLDNNGSDVAVDELQQNQEALVDITGVIQAVFLSFITKLQSRSSVLMKDAKFASDNLQELL